MLKNYLKIHSHEANEFLNIGQGMLTIRTKKTMNM